MPAPRGDIVAAIKAVIKEIAALPPVKEEASTSPSVAAAATTIIKAAGRPSRPVPRPERPVRPLANGWANFEAQIKANDKSSSEERKAKEAEFLASGVQHAIKEVYKGKPTA